MNVCGRFTSPIADHSTLRHDSLSFSFSLSFSLSLQTFDSTETRLLVTHASPGREGLLAQLALALKADLTLSAGLHFRYGVSYNEFSVQHDSENFRNKLVQAKASFGDVWDTVRSQVESVIDDRQRVLLNHALAVTNRVPPLTTSTGAAGEEPAWKNTWNWNLPDAAYGNLVLELKEGRVSAEMKSQGFNFAYRKGNSTTSAITPVGPSGSTPMALTNSNQQLAPNTSSGPATNKAANAPLGPAAMSPTNKASAPVPALNGSSSNPAPPTAPKAAISPPTAPAAINAPAFNPPTGPSSASSQANKKKRNSKSGSVASISASERGNISGNETSTSRSDIEGPGAVSGTESTSGPSTKKTFGFGLAMRDLEKALPVSELSVRKYFGIGSKIEKDIKGVKMNFAKPQPRAVGGDESGKESGKEDSLKEKRAKSQRPLIYIDFATKEIRDEASKFNTLPQGKVLQGDQEGKSCEPKLEISDKPIHSAHKKKSNREKAQDVNSNTNSSNEKENGSAIPGLSEKKEAAENSAAEDSKSVGEASRGGRGGRGGNRGRGNTRGRGKSQNNSTPSGAVAAAE